MALVLNLRRLTPFFCLLLLSALIACNVALAGPRVEGGRKDNDSDVVIRQVENEIGPIAKRGEYPSFYKLLDSIQERLQPAFQKVLSENNGTKENLSWNVVVVESAEVNALFSLTKSKLGGKKGYVFVTTALLNALLKGNPVKGAELVAGIMAHEFAHAIDELDEAGLWSKEGLKQQDIELKTDALGRHILREAELPAYALADGIKKIHSSMPEVDFSLRNTARDFFSTHPEYYIRQSAYETAATAERFDLGDYKTRELRVVLPDLETDLKKAEKKVAEALIDVELKRVDLPKLHIKLSNNFAEILSALQAYWAARPDDHNADKEMSRLYKHMAEILNRRPELSDSEAKSLALILGTDSRFIASSAERGHAQEMIRARWQPLLKTHGVFRSQVFTATMKDEVVRALKETSWATASKYNKAQRLLATAPPRLVLDAGSEIIADEVAKTFPDEKYARSLRTASMGMYEFFGNTNHWTVIDFFHRHIQPKLTGKTQQEILMSVGDSTLTNLKIKMDPWLRAYEIDIDFDLVDWPKTNLEDITAEELQTVRTVAKKIWDERGLWATQEVFNKRKLNWALIADVLDIPRDDLAGQIEEAFIKNIQDSDFFETAKLDFSTSLTDSWLSKKSVLALRQRALKASRTPKSPKGMSQRLKLSARVIAESIGFDVVKELLDADFAPYRRVVQANSLDEYYEAAEIYKKVDRVLGDLWMRAVGLEKAQIEAVADLIIATAPTVEIRAQALREYLAPGSSSNSKHVDDWVSGIISVFTSPVDLPSLYKKFKTHGAVADSLELVFTEWSKKKGRHRRQLLRSLLLLSDDVIVDLKRRSLDDRLRFIHQIAENVSWEYGSLIQDEKPIARSFVEKLVEVVQELPSHHQYKFKVLTLLGNRIPMKKIDDALMENVRRADSTRLYEIFAQGSKSKKIHSPFFSERDLNETVAKFLQLKEKTGVMTQFDFIQLVNKYVELVPKASTFRDEQLEDLLWRVRIKDGEQEVLNHVHALKSTTPESLRTGLSNRVSAVSSVIQEFTLAERLDLIEYLARGDADLPTSLEGAFNRLWQKEGTKHSTGDGSGLKEDTWAALASFKQDGSLYEKTPAFHFLLTAGKNAPIHDEAALSQIRRILALVPDSGDEKQLLAYLKAAGPREHATTLAYLLAVRDEPSGIVKKVSAFGPVGFKVGQLGSLWEIFGPKFSAELADLKDNAAPLDKYTLTKLIRERVGRSVSVKIKERLGSASLKTVVLAEIDGKEVVVLVRRPNAEKQISAQIDRLRRFAQELKNLGVKVPPALDTLIAAAEEQLIDEVKFLEEFKKIKQAQSMFAGLNEKMKGKLGGWRFSVPALEHTRYARDDLLFVARAKGETIHKIRKTNPQLIQEIGEVLVASQLELFFEEGWFDPDRHGGNFILDARTKTIHAIDFGQAVSFKKTPSLADSEIENVRLLLKSALLTRNIDDVITHGVALTAATARKEKIGSEKIEKLRDLLSKAFAESMSPKELLTRLPGFFAEAGLPLESRVSFGVFKGLLILSKENYVSEAKFNELFVKHLLNPAANSPARPVVNSMSKPAAPACKPSQLRSVLNWLRTFR